MKKLIKKIWKKLPPNVHYWVTYFLCLIKVGKQKNNISFGGHETTVYILGCFQAGGGLSQSAHLYAQECKKSFSKVICVDTSNEAFQSIKNPITDGSIIFIKDILHNIEHATLVIHHNPPQFQHIICALGKEFIRNKHSIAYWAWELEDIPPLWKHALNYVDAVEVPSSFTQKAIAQNTDKPVSVLPHKLPIPKKIKSTYVQNGKLSCLFIMDMGSLRVRKNPEAVINAFILAFTPDQASLTIKLGQTNAFADDYARILAVAKNHEHVQIVTQWMDDEDLEQLYIDHDVYISLHRSEGYGLTIQEALLRNLYVVATGWSGNMDFMQGEKAFPVPYTLVPIEKTGISIDCVKNARWAEANIEEAACILRELHTNLFSS